MVTFQRVANLMAEPSGLLRPRIAWRVLRGNLRRAQATAVRTGGVPIPA
jgi:hypothetical protein